MHYTYYTDEGVRRQITLGGAALLSSAKRLAEENAGKGLRWYKNGDGSQRAFFSNRTYVVYETPASVVK